MKNPKPPGTSGKRSSVHASRSKAGKLRGSKPSPTEIEAANRFFETGRSPTWPRTALQRRMQSSGG
jgi:hypothetical protein